MGDQPQLQGQLLHTVAEIYQSLGENELAAPYWSKAYEVLRNELGETHFDTLNARHGRSQNQMQSGLYRDAEEGMLENVRIVEAMVEADVQMAEVRRTIENDLSIVFSQSGRVQEACELMQGLIAEARRDDNIPEEKLASYLSNYASLLQRQDRFEEAWEVGNQALEIQSRLFSPEHEEVLVSRQNRALLLQQLNRLDSALTEFEELRDVALDALGPFHPTTRLANVHFAGCLLEAERFAEAEEIVQQQIALTAAMETPFHPRAFE